ARPVLASVDPRSETARVVENHACGFTCPPESPQDIATQLRAAMQTPPQLLKEMGQRGRSACSTHYTRSVLTRRYAEVLLATAAARAVRDSRDRERNDR